MQFDKTVNLGHLLIIVSLITGVITVYTTMQVQLAENSKRLEMVEKELDHRQRVSTDLLRWVHDIKTDVAVMKERMEIKNK